MLQGPFGQLKRMDGILQKSFSGGLNCFKVSVDQESRLRSQLAINKVLAVTKEQAFSTYTIYPPVCGEFWRNKNAILTYDTGDDAS